MFSEYDLKIIKRCKISCYGGMRFASTVEEQGKCSKKQLEAMLNIISAAEYRKNNTQFVSRRQTTLDSAFSEYDVGGEL